MSRGIYEWYQRLTGAEPLRASSDIAVSPNEMRQNNAQLGAIFLGAFGFTSQLGLNVIYDSALTCLVVGAYVAWYRPRLRWQVWAGGIVFTAIYAVVLVITELRYPTFYDDCWNLKALSGIRIGRAPIEEYMFAFTMGVFWAPLFEAWRAERQSEVRWRRAEDMSLVASPAAPTLTRSAARI
jgi:hypothetical protein